MYLFLNNTKNTNEIIEKLESIADNVIFIKMKYLTKVNITGLEGIVQIYRKKLLVFNPITTLDYEINLNEIDSIINL